MLIEPMAVILVREYTYSVGLEVVTLGDKSPKNKEKKKKKAEKKPTPVSSSVDSANKSK